MKRIFTTLLTLAISIAVFAHDNANTVKIGVILPLSGDNAAVGQPLIGSLKLFEKESAAKPYKNHYQLIVEDDQMMPRLTAEAANKLLYIDHVNAIVTFGIANGKLVAPMAAHLKVPMICVNASYPAIADGKTNFLHCPPVEDEAARLSGLMSRLHAKRAAFLTVNQPGIKSVIDKVEAQAKAQGIEVVADMVYAPGERDFRTLMEMIGQKKPDIFVPTALSPEIEIIFNQRKQAGLTVPVVAYEVFNFMEDKTPANGFYYVSPSIGTPEFKKRLLEKTGKESAYCVAYVYDALDLFRQAFEKTNGQPEKVGQWLRGLKDYPAAVGPITTTPGGVIRSPICIFQIRNGHPVEVSLEQINP
jgi:branched-chain amino acid transport system substrate-binding protein